MLGLPSSVRVFLYEGICDMRGSFPKLIALTKSVINEEPSSGHLFFFVNRSRTATKILFFDRTGYVIWYKKLSQGTFSFPKKREISYRELVCILEGIEGEKQKKRFTPTLHGQR